MNGPRPQERRFRLEALDVERWTLDVFSINSSAAPAFRRALLRWYRRHGRHDLPWRHTRDPYAVLVSELMLQQTQVSTVRPYYIEWLRRFPDVQTLAAATEADVLHAWQGLGYYARARYLHAAAKQIAHSAWPADLSQLPGVGRYTANAIATFASDAPMPLVEANIARLLARLTNFCERIDTAAGVAHLWRTATALLPKRRAGIYNSALMDLGATICVAGAPDCIACPVRSFCAAEAPEFLPRKTPRAATKLLTEHHSFVRRNGSVLLEQSQSRWRGMWILPRLQKLPVRAPLLHTSEFPFTHHRITLHVVDAAPTRNAHQRWVPLADIDGLPVPSPHRRALDALVQQHSTSSRLPRKVQA